MQLRLQVKRGTDSLIHECVATLVLPFWWTCNSNGCTPIITNPALITLKKNRLVVI